MIIFALQSIDST